MKTTTSVLFIIFFSLALFGQTFAGKYKPGTYKGQAHGREHEGHSVIAVEVTVSANKIENIKVVQFDQSLDHKKYGAAVTQAKDEIAKRLLAKQSLGVDAIADATLSSQGVELAVARALDQATVKSYKPGTYKGMAHGREHEGHSVIEVEVTVSADKITDIKITKYDQSLDHKKYGASVTKAQTSIPEALKTKNGLNVDAVADATLSSQAIELAVARALAQASK